MAQTDLTILMPMAGAGSRFRDAGELRPKPLIPVLGIPMFRLAAASLLARFPAARIVCVVQARHDRDHDLSATLPQALPNAAVATVPALTGGSLETCLAAEALVADRHAPLVVMDCDLTFDAPAYCDRLAAMGAGTDDAKGLLLSFRSRAPRYSFAEVANGRVTRTAEKDPISDRALIGAYGFASAETFFATARSLVARNVRTGGGEYYVSAAYNDLIAQGHTVRLEDTRAYWSFGTPEELAAALQDPALAPHAARLCPAGATA
jgi:hypothetical protein